VLAHLDHAGGHHDGLQRIAQVVAQRGQQGFACTLDHVLVGQRHFLQVQAQLAGDLGFGLFPGQALAAHGFLPDREGAARSESRAQRPMLYFFSGLPPQRTSSTCSVRNQKA
jgi:hypothetical protein